MHLHLFKPSPESEPLLALPPRRALDLDPAVAGLEVELGADTPSVEPLLQFQPVLGIQVEGVRLVDVVEEVLRLAANPVRLVQHPDEEVTPDTIARIARDARQVAVGWDVIVAVAHRRHHAARLRRCLCRVFEHFEVFPGTRQELRVFLDCAFTASSEPRSHHTPDTHDIHVTQHEGHMVHRSDGAARRLGSLERRREHFAWCQLRSQNVGRDYFSLRATSRRRTLTHRSHPRPRRTAGPLVRLVRLGTQVSLLSDVPLSFIQLLQLILLQAQTVLLRRLV